LAARPEGALRHFFQHVVAADGFDDFFLGFVAIVVFIVMRVIALRSRRRQGVIGRYRLVVGTLGTRRVFGMRCVFLRVLVVFVMGVGIMRVIIMHMTFVGVGLMRMSLVRVILVMIGVVVIGMFVVSFCAGRGGGFDGSSRYFGRP
jgi:hypothetical protein